MNKFSQSSLDKLSRVHPSLVRILNAVLPIQDCKIIYGARTREEQERLVKEGLSKTLNSKHIINPLDGFSHAVDVAPYPIDWGNTKRFYYFAGLMVATARAQHVNIRWGGNWDMDEDLDDQTFMDLIHFEIVK
jgi:peptidoglycan L-alanyl-D-glutamate endopeptidase CwlK